VKEYFSPTDFAIGKTIVVYGRRFLIYDVDNFTKEFYWKNFGMTDFTPVDVEIPKPPLPKQVGHLLQPVHSRYSSCKGELKNTLDGYLLLLSSHRNPSRSYGASPAIWDHTLALDTGESAPSQF